MAKKELKTLIEEKVKTLFDLIGSKAKFEVKEEDDAYLVQIDAGEETGLLIGRHGDSVNSIQTILAISLKKELEDKKIYLNVGDWKEKQEEKLEALANQEAQRAVETQEPQALYNLTPSQRRIIHLTLSERDDVETESVGEGSDRYLLIKPKKNK